MMGARRVVGDEDGGQGGGGALNVAGRREGGESSFRQPH